LVEYWVAWMECKWADSKAESLAVPMDYLQAVSLVVTKVDEMVE